MRTVAQGKPYPDEGGGKKPSQAGPRVPARGSAAPAKNGAKKNGVAKAADDLDEMFVDPAPPPADAKKSARAADRRRERGTAPQPTAVPDTRRSLPRRDQKPPSSQAAPAVASLTCTRGPEEGLILQLMEGTYTIGRARENAFVLKDIAASRRHMRIDVDARGARLVDLGSGNGTRLNGRRVSEAELRHGDRIEVGGSALVFSEPGRAAPKADPLTDDAQERVIRAAEKLAAELSERMRFGEGPQGAFEDGHVARTQALPKSSNNVAANGKRPPEAPRDKPAQKLWNETFTNLPLNEIVPAHEPLRGTRGAPQAPPVVMQPVSPPRPLPPPRVLAPPPPRQEYEPSASSRGGSGGSFLLPLLVTAVVVILLGGGILGGYWFTHRDGGAQGDAQNAEAQFQSAMDGAERSMLQEDWQGVSEYAALALQHKPGDANASRYLRKAREKVDEALRRAQQQQQQPPQQQPPQQQPPQQQQAQPPAPTPAAPTQAVPAPTPTPTPAAAAPTTPAPPPVVTRAPPPPRAEPRPRAATPPPAPAPKKTAAAKGKGMSDAQASTAFKEAIMLLQEQDDAAGCKLLAKVADQAPADSRWKEKASSNFERRCN